MNILLKRSVFLIFIFIGFYLFQSEIEKLNNKSLYKKNFKFTDQLQIFEDNKINENKKITNIEIEKLNQKVNEDYTQKKLLRSEIKIKKGDTFLSILKSFNYKQKEIFEIISKIEEYYDLRKLKIGESIIIYKNKIDDIKIIEIFKDIDTLISVSLNQDIEVELKRLKNKVSLQFHLDVYVK